MATNAQELLARLKKDNEDIEALKTYWQAILPDFGVPDARQWRVWLQRHDFNTIVSALDRSIVEYNIKTCKLEELKQKELDKNFLPQGELWSTHKICQYASKVMLNKDADGGN